MIYYDKTLSKADTSVRQTTVEGGHLCKADTKFSPEGVCLRERLLYTLIFDQSILPCQFLICRLCQPLLYLVQNCTKQFESIKTEGFSFKIQFSNIYYYFSKTQTLTTNFKNKL